MSKTDLCILLYLSGFVGGELRALALFTAPVAGLEVQSNAPALLVLPCLLVLWSSDHCSLSFSSLIGKKKDGFCPLRLRDGGLSCLLFRKGKEG